MNKESSIVFSNVYYGSVDLSYENQTIEDQVDSDHEHTIEEGENQEREEYNNHTRILNEIMEIESDTNSSPDIGNVQEDHKFNHLTLSDPFETLDKFFIEICGKFQEEQLLHQESRQAYISVFEECLIERNNVDSCMLINDVLRKYEELLEKELTIPLINVFVNEQLDFFIWSIKGSPGRQAVNDKKVFSFGLIVKILRISHVKGSTLYWALLATVYQKLRCLFFYNAKFEYPKYQVYFKQYFWQGQDVDQYHLQRETDNKKQIRLVSIIRKLAILLWTLLWVDPAEVLAQLPNQFPNALPLGQPYIYLDEDRKLLGILLPKFGQCNNYSFAPALYALYDIVNDPDILKKMFNQFERFISAPAGEIQSFLEDLGDGHSEAHREYFEYKTADGKGMIEILRLRSSKLVDGQYDAPFYQKVFKNDQNEPITFYFS